MERRYSQQIEQLTTELGVQWETTSKVQLELDKQRRENADLRREIAQKQAYIDELKKEMQNKIGKNCICVCVSLNTVTTHKLQKLLMELHHLDLDSN